ncbi:MAG: cell division protein FtsZ [Alphaproteobacteria bacterium]|nr:cell division protein FtsZ [Alphaproteobacteria bacterium]
MAINLHLPSSIDTLRPKITVIGVGGAGGNAVNNMITANLEGVDFVIANTDAQALESAQTDRVIQLGMTVTRGLGAGAKPPVGQSAAEEAGDEIADAIQGSNMLFITAGMGGGTGTGAAPVIARIAKEQGILTVGVVTKPFSFEGPHRMRLAEAGIRELQQYVDTLIVVPNQNLFRIANEKTGWAEAFRLADEVLHSGVRGVTDLIVKPGLVNLDFADIRAVMGEMGKAMMGTGEATGDQRALQAAEAAISNPLLDDVSLKGARAVLVNITGGTDLSLFEVDEAMNRIRDEVDPEANIIFGSTFADAMSGKMRVSVVATGIDAEQLTMLPPAQDITSAAAQAARKPFGGAPGSMHAPRKDVAMNMAPRERTAAEIVRQSGSSTVAEVVRQAATRAPVAQPVIRVIDEPVMQEAVAQPRAQAQQGAAMAAQASQTAQLESAMRIAATAARPAMTAPAMADAGPLFISPRAEVPQQRTLFSTQAPDFEELDEASDAEPAAGKSLFNRLANVGKSIAGSGNRPLNPRMTASAAAPAERKPEVRETTPHASDEDEFYDIPAFLRRQAN